MNNIDPKIEKKPTEWALKHYGGIEGIKKADAFLDKLAQGMVDHLNKSTAENK